MNQGEFLECDVFHHPSYSSDIAQSDWNLKVFYLQLTAIRPVWDMKIYMFSREMEYLVTKQSNANGDETTPKKLLINHN